MKQLFILTFVFGTFFALSNQPIDLNINTLSSSEYCVCDINNNSSITLGTNYQKGWKDGHCRGWKSVKGKYAYCPYAPYAPYPTYPAKSSSYQDGYDAGYARGYADARAN